MQISEIAGQEGSTVRLEDLWVRPNFEAPLAWTGAQSRLYERFRLYGVDTSLLQPETGPDGVIGLLAATALLALSLWLLADWWFVPSRPTRAGRPVTATVGQRLEALGQVLTEAELEQWRPGAVVLSSVALGLIAGVAAFQALGWLVPALCWALGLGSLPFVYIWRKRDQLRAARTEQLAPLLERARDELEASQGLQQVLGILAARGPLALQPALRRLAQDLGRHHDLALALEGSRRRLADPIWDDVAASLLLSHSSGGSLAATLEHLAATCARRSAVTESHRRSERRHRARRAHHAGRADRGRAVPARLRSWRRRVLRHRRRRAPAAGVRPRDGRRLLVHATHGRRATGPPSGGQRVNVLVHYPILLLLAGGFAISVYHGRQRSVHRPAGPGFR